MGLPFGYQFRSPHPCNCTHFVRDLQRICHSPAFPGRNSDALLGHAVKSELKRLFSRSTHLSGYGTNLQKLRRVAPRLKSSTLKSRDFVIADIRETGCAAGTYLAKSPFGAHLGGNGSYVAAIAATNGLHRLSFRGSLAEMDWLHSRRRSPSRHDRYPSQYTHVDEAKIRQLLARATSQNALT